MKCTSAVLSTLLALSILPVSETFAQEFQAYEGRNAIREGDGGTKKNVDGIDFWSNGAPPYRFKLLGFITDRRHKSGLFGMISMSGLESSVAEVAKKSGGDAVIQVSSEAETVGAVGNSYGNAQGTATTTGNTTNARVTGSSSSTSAAVQKQNSKFAVVKYLKEPSEGRTDDKAVVGEKSDAEKPSPQPAN